MRKVAIIGAGISGLSVAHLLKDHFRVKIFEKESTPGGLIRCKRINGNLFHICGGHVFNSKYEDVLDWFWSFFQRDEEFTKAARNSVVYMNNSLKVPYPIENHTFMFDKDTQLSIIKDLLNIYHSNLQGRSNISNFEDFLRERFGQTLYDLYFKPYNEKVWRRRLDTVPLEWLEGKLPMPTVDEIFYNNFNHVEEKAFVHSTFWYEKFGGSQFIVDRLARDLDIECNAKIESIKRIDGKWMIGNELFDKVVFCGNIKQLPSLVLDVELGGYISEIDHLESHGTTAVFCEIDSNPYSWIYLPDTAYESHRIICTGNFSSTNNARPEVITGTVEFTDEISKDDIIDNLARIPLHPKYITHHFNKYTYPIQRNNTREMILSMKKELAKKEFYMTGRFADWEYYNMDVSIKAAMETCNEIITH
jgi:protoporphyrinogen oxidase